ncbi:exodeoxyribonuclease V beta chain domain protein [Mycobacterium xenopi 4042]|uniref:Exodeoxyribonuclease V beta chain domain protein n=1 Tax=Mycobacterium xenopi 4042 TaxID=1299334 RepID=X7Z1M6_MYCXE|nr:exodeoxyribonuclease V beta chain domain protein [Mycobacterium xenopi 4042]
MRHFHRAIDTGWRAPRIRRWCVSRNPSTWPASRGHDRDDEVDSVVVTAPAPGLDIASPLAAMPSGAAFGSLVHAVLETATPRRRSSGRARRAGATALAWWPVDVAADELAVRWCRCTTRRWDRWPQG